MSNYESDPRAVVEARIVRAVEEFYAATGEPYPMRVLSARFTAALRGKFADTMERLAEQGKVRVQYKKTGSRHVYPMTAPAI